MHPAADAPAGQSPAAVRPPPGRLFHNFHARRSFSPSFSLYLLLCIAHFPLRQTRFLPLSQTLVLSFFFSRSFFCFSRFSLFAPVIFFYPLYRSGVLLRTLYIRLAAIRNSLIGKLSI